MSSKVTSQLILVSPNQKKPCFESLPNELLDEIVVYSSLFIFARLNKKCYQATFRFKNTLLFFQIHAEALHNYRWAKAFSVIYKELANLVPQDLMKVLNKKIAGQNSLMASLEREDEKGDDVVYQKDAVQDKINLLQGKRAQILQEKKQIKQRLEKAQELEKRDLETFQKHWPLFKEALQKLLAPPAVAREEGCSRSKLCVIL